ncbi:MAG: hypothetical protein U0941_24745 [Planctomycetaceae bacterium]
MRFFSLRPPGILNHRAAACEIVDHFRAICKRAVNWLPPSPLIALPSAPTWKPKNWCETTTRLRNIMCSLIVGVAQALRTDSLALDVATLSEDKQGVFMGRFFLFNDQSRLGHWAEAAATWSLLDPMGRAWSRSVYRPGMAEQCYARFHFWQRNLQEEHLADAECLAPQGKDRSIIRYLHRLRGDWRLTQGKWALAAASYQEAERLARDTRSVIDINSEIGLTTSASSPIPEK